MLNPDQIQTIETFLLSDHITIKGSEHFMLGTLVQWLRTHREELQRAMQVPVKRETPESRTEPPEGAGALASRIREVK